MANPSAQLNGNDAVLLMSLAYSTIDLYSEWDSFDTCQHPIHWWLLSSYACVLGFRLTHLLGSRLAAAAGAHSSEFLLDLRHKDMATRALVAFTWFVTLPFFVICTMVGTYWLYEVIYESPTCVPTQSHLWFSGFWLALCYASALIYAGLAGAAWYIERRMRKAEENLREIEDADVRSRWGEISLTPERFGLTDVGKSGGLEPAEIKALISEQVLLDDEEAACGDFECSICLQELQPGDTIRRLPNCAHAFHRSCIDLWLLQRADCPLCKRDVRGKKSE